jgi:GxxExxY protein
MIKKCLFTTIKVIRGTNMVISQKSKINSVTEAIISCAYVVMNKLGSGFLEKVYENAMVIELKKNGLLVESQKSICVMYEGHAIGEYVTDIFVENLVIIELKVAKCIESIHVAQTINYLKACNVHYGLILNFKNPILEIKRVVH